MGDYLKLFETHAEYEDYSGGGEMIKPNVSYCEDNNEVHYNPWTWAEEYLTTVALEDGTISFNILDSMGTDMIESISYSTDNGETWTTTNNVNDKEENLSIDVNVNEGDKVLWKGIATQIGCYDENIDEFFGSFFSSTCEFDAKGNVMSLLYGDSYKGQTDLTEKNSTFYQLFSENAKVVNAKNLSLPATTLAENCYFEMFRYCASLVTAPSVLPATTLTIDCYNGMFQGCTSLTTAPELSATTLAEGCYEYMFYNCTSLTTAPELPATTLANDCYSVMFNGCTSLTTAPELPATTLARGCYNDMFAGCASLTTAPELPATTLTNKCYRYMFYACTNLTTAPELSATTLVEGCYSNMFYGCTSLNYIKAMFTTTPGGGYTDNWVSGVASSGTFVKNSAATWNVTGVHGVPTGWTVVTE